MNFKKKYNMEIQKIIDQSHKNFNALMKCEFCGHVEIDNYGYDDKNYYNNVMPNMKCTKCSKSTNSIQPTYVTFEQAKLLKDKGFDILVNSYSTIDNDFIHTKTKVSHNYNDKFTVSRPEQWQVVEWLRLNHGVWIEIRCFKSGNCGFSIWLIEEEYYEIERVEYNSPQKAYSEAFDYILTEFI